MADIKQAALWMQEGKRVRRTAWSSSNPELELSSVPADIIFDIPGGGYGEGVDCVVNAKRNLHMFFSTIALLADDWEIVK